MNQNNRVVSGQVSDATLVDGYHSSSIVILHRKDRRWKEMLGDGLLLRFRDPTNVYQIMIKMADFVVAPQEAKLSLRCWLLFRMLWGSLVIRYMTIVALATHHNRHRKHDYPVSSSDTNFRNLSCYE